MTKKWLALFVDAWRNRQVINKKCLRPSQDQVGALGLKDGFSVDNKTAAWHDP